MTNITWTAKNNSSFLNGQRKAKTIIGAVRAARAYIEDELYGEGKAIIMIDGQEIRIDEKSIFTGFKWKTRNI